MDAADTYFPHEFHQGSKRIEDLTLGHNGVFEGVAMK